MTVFLTPLVKERSLSVPLFLKKMSKGRSTFLGANYKLHWSLDILEFTVNNVLAVV